MPDLLALCDALHLDLPGDRGVLLDALQDAPSCGDYRDENRHLVTSILRDWPKFAYYLGAVGNAYNAGNVRRYLSGTPCPAWPVAGILVVPDGWAQGDQLRRCTDWDRAKFRLPSHACDGVHLAINVTTTSVSLRRRNGSHAVRCRIEFVGDGEPSKFHPGWMYLNRI